MSHFKDALMIPADERMLSKALFLIFSEILFVIYFEVKDFIY